METMYDTLLQLPLFQGLGLKDFTAILGKVRFHFSKYKEGETIIKKGDDCSDLTFLLKGEVLSESKDNEGLYCYSEYFQAPYIIEPQSLFGMTTRYVSSYIAKSDVNIITIDKTYILTELCKYDIFLLNYINIVTNRSQILYDRIWKDNAGNLISKIAYFVLSRSEKLTGEKILKIKMDDFAHILGDTRLSVSKALNELQDKGLLILRRRVIDIPEISLLSEYCK